MGWDKRQRFITAAFLLLGKEPIMSEKGEDLYTIAEIQISYKPTYKAVLRPQITSSEDAYELLLRHWDDNRLELVEEAKLVLLNRANRVIGISNLSLGGINGTIVDTRIILATALKANASSFVLAHNHPSSNTEPSDADKALTEKIKAAGKLMELPLMDHIIVTRWGYYSFADEYFYSTSPEGYEPC